MSSHFFFSFEEVIYEFTFELSKFHKDAEGMIRRIISLN